MKKTLILITIFTFLILSIISCSADSNIIYVNGEENTNLSINETFNFSWENGDIHLLKVWRNNVEPYVYKYKSPDNPLLILDGYDLPGFYTVGTPGNGKNDYEGYFTIEEPDPDPDPDPEPEPEPEPYSGPVFVTHITTLTVTAPQGVN